MVWGGVVLWKEEEAVRGGFIAFRGANGGPCTPMEAQAWKDYIIGHLRISRTSFWDMGLRNVRSKEGEDHPA